MQEILITIRIMLPVMCMLLIGFLLRKINLLPESAAQVLNKLVFTVFLPVLLFNNIRSMDIHHLPAFSFAAFMFLGVFGIFLLAQLIVPKFIKDPRKSGVMIQAIFRTNFAILGLPLMGSMFGEEGVRLFSLAIPVVIPLNTVLSVIALSSAGKNARMKDTLIGVLKNPLNIGMMLGAVILCLPFKMPDVLDKVTKDLANLASPVSLLVLGASLKWKGIKGNRKELIATVLSKQLIIPLVMLSLAVLLGFRQMELGVLIILFGAPVAVASYPTACAMGCDGDLAASSVVLTTVFSVGTLFILIFLGKYFCLL